ncbi:MAG: hypothetical protein ABFD77_02500 [Thermotogota bacterium]
MEDLRALTLWPEWCFTFTKLGRSGKNVENRTWAPPSTLHLGERIAIHAGVAFGGGGGYRKVNEVFAPVFEVAHRAGWRLAIEGADNAVVGYSVLTTDTVREPIHKMPRGAVVAVATFSGYIPSGTPKDVNIWPWWMEDQFGWILKDVVALKEPVACRGKQGLWKLEPGIAAAVLAQVE